MTADPAPLRLRRVVIDTNVWISAALAGHSAPAQVVRIVLAHGIPVLSSATFAELETRLWRPKFDRYFDPQQRSRLLRDLSGAAEWVEPSPELLARKWSRDRDDDMFTHAALAADAGWIVTGDKDLLALARAEEVQIVSPAAALTAAGFIQRAP